MIHINLQSRIGFDNERQFSPLLVEELLVHLDIQSVAVGEEIVLNAEDVSWIEPVGCVVLKAFIEQCYERGIRVSWIEPKNTNLKRFLSYMHVSSSASVLPNLNSKSTCFPIVEVHEDSLMVTVEKLKDVIKRGGVNNEDLLRAFDHSLSEIIQNIFHHSEKNHGYVSVMTFPQKRIVQLAIIDNGIGIRRSLLKNPAFSQTLVSDESALAMAVQAKVTSNPIEHPTNHNHGNMGEGLFWAMEFMKRNQGQFYLHSGNGQLVYSNNETVYKAMGYWQGTIMCLQYNLDHPFPPQEIFDHFAPPDNGINGFDFIRYT